MRTNPGGATQGRRDSGALAGTNRIEPGPPELALFTLAPHSDADTSRAAAKAIVPHLERLERRVLEALRLGALCDRCIQHAAGLDGNTERPRRIALRNRGLIEWDGGYDMSHSRPAKRWRLTDKGRDALRGTP